MKGFIGNGDAVVSPLESLTAFSIVFVMICFLFIGANGFFQSYPVDEADLYVKNIHVAERLISDTGVTVDGSPFWEENPEELEVLGLAAPNIMEGFLVVNSTNYDFIYSLSTSWSGTWSTTGGPIISGIGGRFRLRLPCFLAGTKVLMGDGTYKNIEDVMVGESVFCFDETSGGRVVGKVVRVFHHDTPDELSMGYFVVNNYLGVTPNHMLLTEEGWRTVGSLRVGDRLSNGELVFSVKPVIERVATYDLDVEPFDNYFVLGSRDLMVVHNSEAWREIIEAGTGKDPTEQSIPDYGTDSAIQVEAVVVPAKKTPQPGDDWYFVRDPQKPEGGYWEKVMYLLVAVMDMPVVSSYNFEVTDVSVVESGGKGYTVVNYRYTTSDDNRYAILDWNKTQAMKKIDYNRAKEALGIDERYDFYLNITYLNGSVLLEYPPRGVDYDSVSIVTRFSRNVVVFRETKFDRELISDNVGKDFMELLPFLSGSRELAKFELVVYR